MNEVQKDMRTPIEIALGIDENGMTTASKLYEFLELSPSNYSKWCKTNITENEFAEENVDFSRFVIKYESGVGIKEREDFKLTAHFAKKLSCKGNGERAEQAREYFTTLEERVKQKVIDHSQLSPQMQMLYGMLDQMAQAEREAKEAKQIADSAKGIAEKAVEATENIKDEMITPYEDWRDDINSKVREIAIKADIPYQQMFSTLYKELELKAGCDLSTRQRNKRDRMNGVGCTKKEIDKETSKIAIIEEDKRIKQIFENIVRRYAMKYCA